MCRDKYIYKIQIILFVQLLRSMAHAELTTGGVNFIDSLGYQKPAFYPINVPNEATATNKYYVNMSGGSGTTCSLASPCASLGAVSGKPGTNGSGGSTYIYIKGSGGQLNTSSYTLTGTSSNPIVIKPWPNDQTAATFTASSGCGTNSANLIIGSGVRFVIFDGGPNMLIRFVGASSCKTDANSSTVVTRSNDITLYRVRIDNNGSAGSPLAPANGNGTHQSNFRLINSELFGAMSGTSYGVYAGGGAVCDSENSGFTNMEFRNKIIRDANGRGIQIEPRSRSGNNSSGLIISGNAFRNIGKGRLSHAVELAAACGSVVSGAIVVTNNLMFDLGGGGILIPSWSGASFQIYNNTIYDYAKNSVTAALGHHGITCNSSGCPTIGVRNNIILGQVLYVGSVLPINRTPSNTQANLCPSTSNCGNSPISGSHTPANTFQSTDSNNPNFLKLLTTSNGVGGAANVGLTTDYFGNARPSGGGYDVGAGQATSVAPMPTPTPSKLSTPKNLRVN